MTDNEKRVIEDDSLDFKNLLDNSVMPEEHRKDYHNLNFEHQGRQPRWMFIDNWLEGKTFTTPCDMSLSYSEVVRQMDEGTVLVKTSWKKDYDNSLDLDCDTPFLPTQYEDWLDHTIGEELAGTPIKVPGGGGWSSHLGRD